MPAEMITTERLSLRPPVMADAQDVARAVNDREIARWLTQVPHPYTLEDAKAFIARQTSGKTFLICLQGAVIGCIGTVGEFGYWLARDHWGQGYATEASRAVIDWHFAQEDAPLTSGHAIGNARSRAVLLKMGFEDVGVVDRTHQITGETRRQQVMTLSSERWEGQA
ncbi:GNAT family N-acetyltransferase [Primorskyibacter sp. S187A]|uniref:GNAT family N-acetyltransferase n=1 Tax=Primorskyibacter sp. S187A TaxID=3415130 RepID=UPI003C7A29CB